MAREATIIGQITDFFDDLWDIREGRPTPHGWDLLLGWPCGIPRGRGGSGGPRVILTKEVAGYLETVRDSPQKAELPCGRTTIKRLRKLLGHSWFEDNQLWWLDHLDDLASLTTTDFSKKYSKSTGAVSQNRAVLVGNRTRSAGWWAEPTTAEVLVQKPTEIAADILKIAPVSVRRYRAKLKVSLCGGG